VAADLIDHDQYETCVPGRRARLAALSASTRCVHWNSAAYPFDNANQVRQNLAILVAPTTMQWSSHSLATLVASIAWRNSSLPCEPFPLACLHNNEGSSRRIFPVSRPEPHHLG
jgi:hypothetical protein